MLVEFTGGSGVGKSTLCRAVYVELIESNMPVSFPIEFFLGRHLSKLIRSERLEQILLDIFLCPWSIIVLRKYKKILFFSNRCLQERGNSLLSRVLILRSVFRKVSLASFFQRSRFQNQIVLLDEGSLHIAHLIFINGNNAAAPMDIPMFLSLVPKPQMAIHVRASLKLVLGRTLNRDDPPVRNARPESLEAFVRRALNMFEQLFVHGPIVDTMVDINGEDPTSDSVSKIVPIISKLL